MIILKNYLTPCIIPISAYYRASLVAIEEGRNSWKITKSRYTTIPKRNVPYSLLNKHIKLTLGMGRYPNFNKSTK